MMITPNNNNNILSQADDMQFSEHMSVAHSLGQFGFLHAGTLPSKSMDSLRSECMKTSCSAVHSNVSDLLDGQTLQVLCQGGCGIKRNSMILVKISDGYILAAKYGRGCCYKILAILKDSPMCLPVGVHPDLARPIAPNGAYTTFFSIVTPPGKESTTRPFKLVFHDGFTKADEISRFSDVESIVDQIRCAKPMDSCETAPRVMMSSNSLGTLIGQCLTGVDADLLKRTFMSLVQQAVGKPHCVYDTPIDTSTTISNLLHLNDLDGPLSLTPCKDGIIGYANCPDGRKAFTFVASSDDFSQDKPSPISKSFLQYFKFCCADSNPNGLRILVRTADDKPAPNLSYLYDNMNNKLKECTLSNQYCSKHVLALKNGNLFAQQCPYNFPYILPAVHSVADIIGIVRMAIRFTNLDNKGCADYSSFALQEALGRQQPNVNNICQQAESNTVQNIADTHHIIGSSFAPASSSEASVVTRRNAP